MKLYVNMLSSFILGPVENLNKPDHLSNVVDKHLLDILVKLDKL